MNIWRSSLFCFALLVVQAVSAEEINKSEDKFRRNSYQTNKFFENIFIGASGGVNLYQGRNDNALSIDKRFAPAIDAYVGKWFTPWIGGRITYSGLQAKGWIGSVKDSYYNELFSTMYFHADFMWNISNAIGRYKHERFWNFIPYIGAGYIRLQSSCGYVSGEDFAVSVGLYNTMRISRGIDITLDIRHSAMDSKVLDPKGDSQFDFISTASLGLAFKIGNNRFKRPYNVDVSQYMNRISELKSNYKLVEARAEEVTRELEAERVKVGRILDSIAALPIPITPTMQVTSAVPPVALFFEVGKPDLGAKEMVNLKFYVENVIKAEPKRVFTLTGIVDNSSGSKASNQVLAEKRVSYVYELLVKEFGINPKQLEKRGIEKEGLFPDSRLNRVVIIK